MDCKKRRKADVDIPYATQVGQVDEAITCLERMVEQQEFDWFHIMRVTEMLKTALLEAEERYMEEEGPCLTVLPSKPRV